MIEAADKLAVPGAGGLAEGEDPRAAERAFLHAGEVGEEVRIGQDGLQERSGSGLAGEGAPFSVPVEETAAPQGFAAGKDVCGLRERFPEGVPAAEAEAGQRFVGEPAEGGAEHGGEGEILPGIVENLEKGPEDLDLHGGEEIVRLAAHGGDAFGAERLDDDGRFLSTARRRMTMSP